MHGYARSSAVFRVTAILFLLAVGKFAWGTSNDYSAPIALAVNHWLAVQKPSGLFPYGFDFLADEESEPKTMSAPNLTRQVGTAAVLADYYALTKDQRARPALQRLLTAFGHHSLPIGKSRMQTLVEKTRLLSMPLGRYKIHAALDRFGLLYEKTGSGKVLSPVNDYDKALTGAVALAILTELRYAKTSGDTSFAGLRDAWLEALLGLRIPGDGFRQVPTSIDATPYFDGQAWLAMAEYQRAFPQDRPMGEFLADVDAALMKKYGGDFKIDFFHWGTMAAAARYRDTGDQRFLTFVKAQTNAFLARKKDSVDKNNTCAMVEGAADALGALLSAGEGTGELAARTRAWIATEMRKAQRLQIQPGQKDLVFPNARIIAPRMQEFSGNFRAGIDSTRTQVDVTAHCVSAMVKLRRHDAIRPEK